ncbi:MAG: protein translocase subunit SecD [Eubacterium sp.]
MKKGKSIALFIAMLVLAAAMCYVVVFGVADRGKASYIKQGLDLKGGVSITYQVATKGFTSEQFDDTKYKLELRAQNFSTESEVYKEGDNRITIEIPGETDADEVLSELGEPGIIYFASLISDSSMYDSTHETIKVGENEYEIWLSGSDISNAKGTTQADQTTGAQEDVVELEFTSDGTTKFSNATTTLVGKTLYIIYDGEIISYPTVNSAITSGKAVIEGMEDAEAADSLASTIRIGSLDLELEEISHKVVGAKLGEKALSNSLMAGLIGMIIIILFMIIVYRGPGIAAALSLIVYVLMDLLILNGFDMTLSLPGIAGIVLSIGMAVDANVIIYARIREEIAAGKTVKSAIKIGFQKATSAIVDGNVTTLIASLVLMWKGSGTVQGFAQTLAVGILLSMFSALVISRIFVNLLYNMGLQDAKFYGKSREVKVINFLKNKVVFFAISIIIILAGIGTMVGYSAKGGDPFYYSIEFAGGRSISVEFDKDYTISEFNDEIKPAIAETLGHNDIQGQIESDTGNIVIKTKTMDSETFDALKTMLIEDFGAVDSDDNFTNTDISATVSKEMRDDAVVATVLATICMLIYIWIRFKDIKFATSAVIALIHDVLVVIAFYAISRTTVGTTFIACMLTIVGYSINATIVIFDRIRENLAERKKGETISEIVNNSITQTLTRSIYTSFTTFIMVVLIYILGVSSIREFALPLMVGIIAGGYSSVCITGALWFTMTKAFSKKEVK